MDNDNINVGSVQGEPYVSELISDAVMPESSDHKNAPEVKAPSNAEVVAYQIAHPVKEIGKAQIIAGIVAIISAIIAIAGLISEW